MLHYHEPERVSPVPRIVFDNSMRIHLDPEVEGDERPAEDPAEDVHDSRVVFGEVEVGPSETGVRYKVAVVNVTRTV